MSGRADTGVRTSLCVCVRACVCACVRVCVVGVYVFVLLSGNKRSKTKQHRPLLHRIQQCALKFLNMLFSLIIVT